MKKRKEKTSYYKKPEELSVEEWQRELRKKYVGEKEPAFIIKYLGGEHQVFGDYSVENPASRGKYKVALRSSKIGPNFCYCMDFKTNMLGTCKHIEAVLYRVGKDKKLSRLLVDDYKPSYSSIYLKYGVTREVILRIGIKNKNQYEQLAKKYFDSQYCMLPNTYDKIDQFLIEAISINHTFRCYPDAINFIIKAREDKIREAVIKQKMENNKDAYFETLLKITLYPYQKEGIIFVAKAGRALLADDMGLGKTIQAVGATQVFKKEFNITNALIICPTSLKYQWKSEIEKFTDESVLVIEGDPINRRKQYETDNFYKIVSYNLIAFDIDVIKKLNFDLVILDEAQRIKNWKTKTAKEVKKIESKFAIVLTGTPIENKLEELYSIVQFIDPFKLGPLYKFLSTHQIHDESGKVVGYKKLNQIQNVLSDIVIRRTKKDVMNQLPTRTDKNLFVPLTPEQADIHGNYADMIARLVSKWKKLGFLDEKDRQRLLLGLNCMRMVSDSTFILDQETRFDTKINELMCILDDIFTSQEKVVIFSQWERMTRLVKMELDKRNVGYAYLHGGVKSHHRKVILENFHQKNDCRVFLSTDAGGVGLNLQCASFVINLDIPWNPAVLEQRIGRIYRHGQKRNINVINLVSRQSIEERMLDILKFKSSLFAGVLDNGEDNIFMREDRFKQFMSSVEQVTSAPQPASIMVTREENVDINEEKDDEDQIKTPTLSSATDFFASAKIFLDSLQSTLADKQKTEQLTMSFIEKDKETGKTYIKIPVENQEVVNKAIDALTGFLSLLKKS